MKCYGFQWLGQRPSICDGCGEPYWEHTHYETIRNRRWFRKVISPAEKANVKAKWGTR